MREAMLAVIALLSVPACNSLERPRPQEWPPLERPGEGAGVVVGDEIKITIDAELVLQVD